MDGSSSRPLVPGSCTVIAARQPRSDDALLVAELERAAGLAAGALPPGRGLDRPEVKVVEGVDRASADRIAAAAARAGFRPRVVEALGIRWSAERGRRRMWGAAGAMFAWLLVTGLLDSGGDARLWTLSTGPVLMFGVMAMVAVTRRDTALHLAWDAASLFHAAAVDGQEVAADAERARRALDALERGIDGLPATARVEVEATVRALRERVAALERRGPILAGSSPEDAAAREALRAELATIAREAAAAEDQLGGTVPASDLLQQLRGQVDAVRAADAEVDPARRSAAARARASQRERSGS